MFHLFNFMLIQLFKEFLSLFDFFICLILCNNQNTITDLLYNTIFADLEVFFFLLSFLLTFLKKQFFNHVFQK